MIFSGRTWGYNTSPNQSIIWPENTLTGKNEDGIFIVIVKLWKPCTPEIFRKCWLIVTNQNRMDIQTPDRETANWCVCSLRPSWQASREEREKGKKDRGLIKRGKLAALFFPFRHFSLPLFPFTLFAPAKWANLYVTRCRKRDYCRPLGQARFSLTRLLLSRGTTAVFICTLTLPMRPFTRERLNKIRVSQTLQTSHGAGQ